uniref:DAF-12 A1 n=2 Tax=Pristionchus pacificus TaxID=54126 RepID=D3TJM1_PRIPA|nr:DAF-12 A1 [Pristionchus pacificus]ACJ01654.1 DAF-12 A5 [Pristionchus pacificus]
MTSPRASAEKPSAESVDNAASGSSSARVDSSGLVNEIRCLVASKEEMELDKVAVTSRQYKMQFARVMETLNEPPEEKVIKEERPGLLPVSPSSSEDDEPQMNTPEDPVIHSPPSLRAPVLGSPTSIAAALHNSPLNQGGYGQSPTGCDGENRTSCESPGSAGDATDPEGRRRQKTCRVCGDHATGYNFNVITCESCKAFFRRNALRPKEFKCPYSEDCDINSVSRRFCQKCRLRKCFSVGMKKEWILNEEQLRRRKNSRLNNMANQQRNPHDPSMKNISSPVSVLTSPQMSLHSPPSRHGGLSMGPIVSPPSVTTSAFSLLSPTDSSNSDSPPGQNRCGPLGGIGHHSSTDSYDSALLLQQRLQLAQARQAAVQSMGSPQSMLQLSQAAAAANRGVTVDPLRGRVMMSIDEYQSLMQMAQSSNLSPMGLNGDQGSPDYKPNVFSPPMNMTSPLNGGSNGLAELGAGHIKHEFDERLKNYLDGAINDELNGSPDLAAVFGNGNGKKDDDIHPGDKLSFQLNTAELRALDNVREAFSGMNETLDSGKQRESFMKNNKTPTDIMNIMDITMRRLVKMSKKLPAFNELSNEGKFALLKGGMVEMLTVRGVTRYDASSNSWKTPVVPDQYNVPVSMFDQLNMDCRDEQKHRFMQFVSALHEDLRKNELAISLIMLIVLFSHRDNVNSPNDRILIDKHHRDYSALLFRYLESLYGEDARKFQEILPRALELLHVISDHSITLFMGTVKTEEAEPLPREFFKTD